MVVAAMAYMMIGVFVREERAMGPLCITCRKRD